MISFPNAKINLGLHIIEKRNDGYHNIETIFYPIKLSDILEFIPIESNKDNFNFSGYIVDGNIESNIVYKALKAVREKYKIPFLDIHLHKKIPMGAGLGGGSSDAAFMINMLDEYFDLKMTTDSKLQIAKQLGADCSFFIKNEAMYGEGIGDILSHINVNISDYQIIIAKPNIHVNTANAYRDVKPKKRDLPLKELISLPISEWKNALKNDFEASVFAQHPEIESVKEYMYKNRATYAAMSGSGATVFGIFDKKENVTPLEDTFWAKV